MKWKTVLSLSLSIVCSGAVASELYAWGSHKYVMRVSCRPYNAFTPFCWGSLNCVGCCPTPCCAPSCGMPSPCMGYYPPPWCMPQACYGGGCPAPGSLLLPRNTAPATPPPADGKQPSNQGPNFTPPPPAAGGASAKTQTPAYNPYLLAAYLRAYAPYYYGYNPYAVQPTAYYPGYNPGYHPGYYGYPGSYNAWPAAAWGQYGYGGYGR